MKTPALPYVFEDEDGDVTIVAFKDIGCAGFLHLVDPVLYATDLRFPIYPWGTAPPDGLDLELFVARRLKVVFFAMYRQYTDEMLLYDLEVVDVGEYDFTVRVRFAVGEPSSHDRPSMGGPTFEYKRGEIFF